MKPILILYATCEGQTEKIARYIAGGLRTIGLEVDLFNAASVSKAVQLSSYETAILAGSVHIGGHEPELVKFARANRADLETMKASFVTVSGSQIGVEIPSSPPEMRTKAAADVRMMVDKFAKQTGWQPARVLPVAGALMYRKYNFLVRFVMRQIAKKSGGSTDASRNHEYTDWSTLDSFIHELAASIIAPSAMRTAA